MKRIPLIGILLLVFLKMAAQQDVSFAHYWTMEPSFNPATVGKSQKMNITGAYQMSLTGYEHHPRTMSLAADVPLQFWGSSHGLGIQLLNDELGLFTHKRMVLQYALRRRLLGGTVAIGIQGGFVNEGFKGSDLDMENPSDPALSAADVNGMAMDLSAGLYYQRGDWYAGISVLHANAPSVEIGERSIIEVSRTYYLTGGYNIRMRNPFLSIQSTVLAQTDGTTYRVDATARLKYTNDRKLLYIGAGYSPSNSVTALVGGNFHGVCIGYSYEMYTSGAGIGNGSHELFVGYQTDIDLGKKKRNRHQSVRLL